MRNESDGWEPISTCTRGAAPTDHGMPGDLSKSIYVGTRKMVNYA